MDKEKADIIIVGTGVAGLFAALHLPREKKVVMVTKEDLKSSDSYLAQGGICVLRNEGDYASFMEDTLKAGHYENRKESVDIMIRSSRAVIEELIALGVEFHKEGGELAYTREGAHSRARILYHKDITGQEITSKLLAQVKKLPNVKILPYTVMIDILEEENRCFGIIARKQDGSLLGISAPDTIWASGGIGGLFRHSTNFPHLTGDALAIALKHDIALEHPEYIQIHPTTLYSKKPGRRFLISESVRGEGAKLYNSKMERFANEVLPRDLLSRAIYEQMEKDKKPYVWLDMRPLGKDQIMEHFPNIYQHCMEEGYDVTRECIPVVPAQHYFMGGVKVDRESRTTMAHLYAAGETSCNGVHGANRLASNSLLESLVFARIAAKNICDGQAEASDGKAFHKKAERLMEKAAGEGFLEPEELWKSYRESVLLEIEKERKNK